MKKKTGSYKERMAALESSAVERGKTFKRLVQHIVSGHSMDCFDELSIDQIERFCKDFSEEFDENLIEEALRKGKNYWEAIGNRQANGTCLGNSRSWYYNMVNRYGWRERVDVQAKTESAVSVSIVSYASTKPAPSDA